MCCIEGAVLVEGRSLYGPSPLTSGLTAIMARSARIRTDTITRSGFQPLLDSGHATSLDVKCLRRKFVKTLIHRARLLTTFTKLHVPELWAGYWLQPLNHSKRAGATRPTETRNHVMMLLSQLHTLLAVASVFILLTFSLLAGGRAQSAHTKNSTQQQHRLQSAGEHLPWFDAHHRPPSSRATFSDGAHVDEGRDVARSKYLPVHVGNDRRRSRESTPIYVMSFS